MTQCNIEIWIIAQKDVKNRKYFGPFHGETKISWEKKQPAGSRVAHFSNGQQSKWSGVKNSSKQKVVNIFATALGKNKGCWTDDDEWKKGVLLQNAACSKGSSSRKS